MWAEMGQFMWAGPDFSLSTEHHTCGNACSHSTSQEV